MGENGALGRRTAGSFEGGDSDVIEPDCVLIGFCAERTRDQAAR